MSDNLGSFRWRPHGVSNVGRDRMLSSSNQNPVYGYESERRGQIGSVSLSYFAQKVCFEFLHFRRTPEWIK